MSDLEVPGTRLLTVGSDVGWRLLGAPVGGGWVRV